MTRVFRCSNCVHYYPGSRADKRHSSCKAFPEGIPRLIISEATFHLKKHKDQVGDYTFEPKKDNELIYENELKYIEYTEKTIDERFMLEDEVKRLVSELIDELNKKKYNWIRGEVRLNREDSSMVIKNDEILFYDQSKASELYSLGVKSELFKKLKTLLFIESVLHHETDLELIIFNSGEYKLSFSKLNWKERKEQNKEVSRIYANRTRTNLISKGLVEVSTEELTIILEDILLKEERGKIPHDNRLAFMIQKKGYVVLPEDVEIIRKKLGYKSRLELIIERKNKED